MALWDDPLDELIADLERVVPPEPPKKLQLDIVRLLGQLQAEAATSVVSPEATMSDETQIFRLMEEAREGERARDLDRPASPTRADTTINRRHGSPDGQSI